MSNGNIYIYGAPASGKSTLGKALAEKIGADFTDLDAVIVGGATAVFMAIARMDYIGLIAVVCGVTNLIPSFGPIIGGAIGGFILLLVNPWHALMFLAFTAVLQTLDGYVIKPKLFGDSLGVSGLLILVAIIVFGNIFGIVAAKKK